MTRTDPCCSDTVSRAKAAEDSLATANAEIRRNRITILNHGRERATLTDQQSLLRKTYTALQTEHGTLQEACAVLQREADTAVRVARERASTAEAESANAAWAARASAAASTVRVPVSSQVRCQRGAA